MEKLKTTGQFAVAFGLVYLACAIVFLGVEASALRKQVPVLVTALDEMEEGGETHPLLARIDKVLAQVPRMTHEVAAIREEMPKVLEESAAIRELIPDILAEIKEVREAMVPVLEESAALRRDLPLAISQAGGVVNDAKGVSKGIGKGAAEGAVGGAVKGIIKAPFEVLKQGADLVIPDGAGDKGE